MTNEQMRVYLYALSALFDDRLATLNWTLAEQTELPRHAEWKWIGKGQPTVAGNLMAAMMPDAEREATGKWSLLQGLDVIALDELREFGGLLREAVDALGGAR